MPIIEITILYSKSIKNIIIPNKIKTFFETFFLLTINIIENFGYGNLEYAKK